MYDEYGKEEEVIYAILGSFLVMGGGKIEIEIEIDKDGLEMDGASFLGYWIIICAMVLDL